MNKIYLKNEFAKFWNKIELGENFVFMRNGDGEKAIMNAEYVVAQEGWEAPGSSTQLGRDLLSSLSLLDDNVFYGITCPCCNPKIYFWYLSRIKSRNITFANLWVNANYEKFKENFSKLKRDAILIANYRAVGHEIGNLNILKHYVIDDDCISFWENKALHMIETIKKDFGNKNNLLYIVSAGPMSSPIIAKLYKNNPQNCYIDFGSAIDTYYRKQYTRPYMQKGSKYANHNDWMFSPSELNIDVTVVLNLYKRPENLKLQLEALEKQSLKPKEIILYQDGTSETVSISENIKNKFDFIKIGSENKGVWERFRFALQYAKSKYVCIFDDDTIPGCRWLENCMTEMLKQEGLYGTIGIVMDKPEDYPKTNSYFRVGWDGQLNYTAEVDFVGHSWFLKKEWLEELFKAPSEIQEYKKVGEDMSLSHQLLKKGIKTFVPPHPKDNKDMFGSIPEISSYLGDTDVAISYNGQNSQNMNNAIKILLKDGWQTLKMRNPKYISKLKKRLYHNFFNIVSYEKNFKHKIIKILGIKLSFKQKY